MTERDAYPMKGQLVDRDTGIELKEFYNGDSTTIHKAFKGKEMVAVAKDRTSLVRLLRKKFKA